MLEPGRLRLSLDVTGTYIETGHDVDPAQYERDPVTGQVRPDQAASHEVDMALFDFSLSGSLALRPWLALEARVPFRLARTSARFRDAEGRELEAFDSIHHRDETLFGLADIELWDRFRLLGAHPDARTTLDLRLGVAIPTGGIEDDPYELGARGVSHQHIFFGSGTLDPIGGVDVWHRLDGVTLNAYVNGRATLYENPRGYRAGSRGSLGALAQSGLGLSRWTFLAGAELYHERPSRWASGLERLEAEALQRGRTALIPALGAVYAPADALWLRAMVKRPFTIDAADGELEIPLMVNLGVDVAIDAFQRRAAPQEHGEGDGHAHGDGHEHGHEHEHEHGHDVIDEVVEAAKGKPRGDVTELARGGETFELGAGPAAGKITVIDFWAEWCEPCHDIDRMLAALAALHPELAVRRVEIVDFDSPAARDHLRGVPGLPVVWIYDRKGRRVKVLPATSARQVYDALSTLLKR